MNDYAVHANAMAQIQRRLGDSCPIIIWNAMSYALIPGSATRRADLGSGGFALNADLSCEALVSTFADGDTITDARSLKNALLQTPVAYLGDVYKVQSVYISPGGLQVRIEANGISQGA